MGAVTKPIRTTVVMTKPGKKPPLKSFRDLGTWQLASELAVAVYRQCELFPEREGKLLECQMTQASVQACANIAESFSNKGEERERLFTAALAALNRLENYLYIALDLGFLSKAQCDDLNRRGSNTRWALVKLQKINREWMGK